MSAPWAVVIPSDSEGNLAASATSVLARHPQMDPRRIYVVSRTIRQASAREGLRRLSFVHDETPFRYARSINLGFAASGDADVVVMGDDVEVATDGAFDLLGAQASLRVLAASVRGRVGPWWQREGQDHLEAPFVSFTCVYIPRTVYHIVGPLEESFPGYGYEDTDFCLRARRAGLSCGVCGAVVVEHSLKIPSAFVTQHKDALPDMEAAARVAFEEKWRRRLM